MGYPAIIDSPLDEGQGEVHVAKKSAPAAKTPSSATNDIPVVATPGEIWKDEPDTHDYPAAVSYLRLLTTPKWAKKLAKQMKTASIDASPCQGPPACFGTIPVASGRSRSAA